MDKAVPHSVLHWASQCASLCVKLRTRCHKRLSCTLCPQRGFLSGALFYKTMDKSRVACEGLSASSSLLGHFPSPDDGGP